MTGWVLESVTVTGPEQNPASVRFADGLNVIAGASDTGKSYLVSLIDYALGASTEPRQIEAASGYTTVEIRIREREGTSTHEIRRTFGSPRAIIRSRNGVSTEANISTSHSSSPTRDTLSARLLLMSGFAPDYLVRTNAGGTTRRLSFRDIAYLCIVDEARIIAERPPYRSGSYIENTSRTEVLKLVATGVPSALASIAAELPSREQGDSVRQELLLALIGDLEREIGDNQLPLELVTLRIEELQLLIDNALAEYDASTVAVNDAQEGISAALAALREVDARLVVSEGLRRRFSLLEEHYQSDLARLDAIAEATDLLTVLPFDTCPVCGAAAEHHRPELVHADLSVDGVREAAIAERGKTSQLLNELTPVVERLAAQQSADLATQGQLRATINGFEQEIAEALTPRQRASKTTVDEASSEIARLAAVEARLQQLRDLRVRTQPIDITAPVEVGGEIEEPTSLVDQLEPFTLEVQTLLTAWNVPAADEVHFSDATMDLVIHGERRASHGKGVRALTCAAFILGLARNANLKDLPHPGMVILDSPLVAYKESDPTEDSGALIAAGVKEAFYRSLADGLAGVQVLVLENEEPPVDVISGINYERFSKSSTGRYGFFPRS